MRSCAVKDMPVAYVTRANEDGLVRLIMIIKPVQCLPRRT